MIELVFNSHRIHSVLRVMCQLYHWRAPDMIKVKGSPINTCIVKLSEQSGLWSGNDWPLCDSKRAAKLCCNSLHQIPESKPLTDEKTDLNIETKHILAADYQRCFFLLRNATFIAIRESNRCNELLQIHTLFSTVRKLTTL